MSDLFHLVRLNKVGQHNEFWGKYKYLNQAKDYPDSILFKLQLSRMKLLEQSNRIQYQNANAFLREIRNQTASYSNIEGKFEKASEAQIYARIVQLINSGLISSPLNPTARHTTQLESGQRVYSDTSLTNAQNRALIKNESQLLVQELETLLGAIHSANTGSVKRLEKTFGLSRGPKFKDGFSTYAQYKANEAEVLMTEALNRHPGWKALQTGSFYHKGQQLLEDAFVFDMNTNITFDQNMKVTIKRDNKSKTVNVKSLEEFFKLMESLNVAETVHLSDELYEKMQQIAVLTAQAKSGVGIQTLLNETVSRNSMSLGEMGPTSTLISLYALYREGWIDDDKESNTLSSIANYCLSKSIALTNISRNAIYFTRDGFITASEWMETYKYMLKFNPEVRKMHDNFFNQRRPYVFRPVKN